MQEAQIEYVSVTNFIKQYPMFLNLHERFTWEYRDVGYAYSYPESVHSGELYAYNGVVMELFMRKCICRKYGIPCSDGRTETELWRSNFRDITIKERLHEAYQDYCNPDVEAINIVDQIKMVALSHRLAHDEHIENVHDALHMEVDTFNLRSIMEYVDSLQYNSVRCKERCTIAIENVHMCGVPDYVFDGDTICHVATSMRSTVYPNKMSKTVFYMLGHYSNNYYHANVTKEYTIVIYNPLLGIEHKLKIRIRPSDFTTILNGLSARIQNIPRILDPANIY